MRVINQNIEQKGVKIALGSSIKGDLALDSLSVLMILNALEEEFGVTLEESDFLDIETVGGMIEHIRTRHPEFQGSPGA